jgi:hypothetical protein
MKSVFCSYINIYLQYTHCEGNDFVVKFISKLGDYYISIAVNLFYFSTIVKKVLWELLPPKRKVASFS